MAYSLTSSTHGQLQTLDELAKHTPNQNAAITVGKSPSSLGVDSPYVGKVYVANEADDSRN